MKNLEMIRVKQKEEKKKFYANESIAVVSDDFNITAFVNFCLQHSPNDFKLVDDKLYFYNEEVEFVLSEISYFTNSELGYKQAYGNLELITAWDNGYCFD